jgi:hypothetical protein
MYVENSTQVTVMMFHMAHPCDKFLTSLISGLTFGFVGSTAGRSKCRLMANAFLRFIQVIGFKASVEF